jgi:hypothetical protein
VERAGAPTVVYLRSRAADNQAARREARDLMDAWTVESARGARDGLVVMVDLRPGDARPGAAALVAGARHAQSGRLADAVLQGIYGPGRRPPGPASSRDLGEAPAPAVSPPADPAPSPAAIAGGVIGGGVAVVVGMARSGGRGGGPGGPRPDGHGGGSWYGADAASSASSSSFSGGDGGASSGSSSGGGSF